MKETQLWVFFLPFGRRVPAVPQQWLEKKGPSRVVTGDRKGISVLPFDSFIYRIQLLSGKKPRREREKEKERKDSHSTHKDQTSAKWGQSGRGERRTPGRTFLFTTPQWN